MRASQRSTVAGWLRESVGVPLASLQQKSERARQAVLGYGAVVRVADSVRMRAAEVDGLAAENDQLRRLLGLGAALRWGFVPAEVLQGRGLGDDFTVTLSAGQGAGVEPFSAVVSPDGLVGMVERVDVRSSLAIVWPHPDFRVSAMSADGAVFGIVYPHLGSGASRYLLELRGVAFRHTLEPGALVVSAGTGGVYPRGIPIGTVVREIQTSEGWARTFLLLPSVRPADVMSVMIIKPQRALEGVTSVWQSAVDSALRTVLVAGDSLVRRRADSLAAAERRRLDSLQAVQIAPDSLEQSSPILPPRTTR